MTNDNFKFWFPIEKSQEIDPETGQVIMRLGGIASTADEDSDGEFLDPNGFDIEPLMKSGLVNWHHQAKGQPSAIIGEPTKAEICPEGLYIETDLYPSSKIAQDVWLLANTLERDSKTRRLGYSIEGKVLKRKSNNQNDPDFKKILKAVITGVAVTHQPKNSKTFANIIKGDIDDDFVDPEAEEDVEEDEAKDSEGMNTKNASALIKESLDKKIKPSITFDKSEVLDIVFRDIAGISISKAEKVCNLIIEIANMSKRKSITVEDISKAYEALGLNYLEEDISKADDFDEEDVKEVDEETDDEEDIKEVDEENEEQDTNDNVAKAQGVNRFDRIEKALATSYINQTKYIKALGVMVKDVANKASALIDENESLMQIIKAQEDTILGMSERIEAFGSEVPAPKSLSNARPVERMFAKGGDDNPLYPERSMRKSNQISMSQQKGVVSEILDQATFAKGFDEEFSKACTHFEAAGNLPSNIIARIKNEMGIEIVE